MVYKQCYSLESESVHIYGVTTAALLTKEPNMAEQCGQ